MKSKSILSLVLTATLVFSSGITVVHAKDNATALYANAYNAVIQCLKTRTQESINNARKNILALKGTNASWAIGEFSKQTDTVQQELFEKFMGILFDKNNRPVKSLTQEEINIARELVMSFDTYDGNKQYTSPWCSAIDPYQQALINNATTLVSKAESSKMQVDINTAKTSVNELLTAKYNDGVVSYAKTLLDRINNINIYASDPVPGVVFKPSAEDKEYRPNSPYDFKNYVRWYWDEEYDLIKFEKKLEELARWQRAGYVEIMHDITDVVAFMDLFKNGDYYKGMSPYACTIIKDYAQPSGQENCSEIVRLIDGQVLVRVWEYGKVETFEPTILTQEQIETYKNSTYDEMKAKLK